MKRFLICAFFISILIVASWAQTQPAAKIFMVNASRDNFYIQVGEDNAWAFKYDCPPLSASSMLELDSRFMKSYKVYYDMITETGKVRSTVMTYSGEGDPGAPLVLELKAGKIYCLLGGDGVSVFTLADPPGNNPRICFSSFFMGPPVERIELGKAWGKETALFTGEVGNGTVTDFMTFKPGTYNFFYSHIFYPDTTTVFDKNGKPFSSVLTKERAYYLFYLYRENEALVGAILDITPAAQPQPELFASGKYKVDLSVGKKTTSTSWDLTLKDQKITGFSTENNVQYRLEGIVVKDVVKIVCFKDKELLIFE